MLRYLVATLIIFIHSFSALFAQKTIFTHIAKNENKGDQLYYNFAYSEALEAYQAALTQYPDEDRIELKIAETYRALNQPEQASKYYALVVNNESVSSSVNKLHYAQTLSSLGNYQEAKIWYEKYKQEVDNDSRADRNLDRLEKLPELLKDSLTYFVDKLNINSKKADFSPTYYQDGIVFVSSRVPEKGVKSVYKWNKSYFLDLYYSVENEDGSNAEPQLFHRNINTKLHEGPTVFYDNDSKMIFTRNNLIKGKQGESSDGIIKLKMYKSEKLENNSWSKPSEISFNSDEYSVGHPSLSSDGLWLYFVSDMPGGFGGTDIYKSKWNGTSWAQPENLGSIINTEGNEMFPYYHNDGTLYFSSIGHGGLGGLDIYSINLENDQSVKNMGYPINTRGDDFGLIVSQNGQSGYFSSNRKDGIGDDDIYHFRIKNEIIKVNVYDQITNNVISSANVELIDTRTLTTKSKTDHEGNANFIINPKQSYLIKITKLGYNKEEVFLEPENLQVNNISNIRVPLSTSKQASDTTVIDSQTNNIITPFQKLELVHNKEKFDKYDSAASLPFSNSQTENKIIYYEIFNPQNRIQDFVIETGVFFLYNYTTLDTNRKNLFKTEERAKIIQRALISSGYDVNFIQIKSIYYDFDKYLIRNDASAQLDKLVNLMVEYPKLKVNLNSHTDSRGTSSYNEILARQRSKEAKDYLIKEGVSPNRIFVNHFGESNLINNCNDSNECNELLHQENRRTEIEIIFE